MKRPTGKILIVFALLMLPILAWGQKRIYTKSFRLQDFKSKTTRVVLSGSPEFNQALRENITSLWTISPYEFCSQAEFEKQKNNPDMCFLYPESKRGRLTLQDRHLFTCPCSSASSRTIPRRPWNPSPPRIPA